MSTAHHVVSRVLSVFFLLVPLSGCIEYTLHSIDGAGDCGTVQVWDSDKDTSIAVAECDAPAGYLLTGIRVFREPTANLDNFIARLDCEFTKYEGGYGALVYGDDTQTCTVYNGEYRTGSGEWIRLDDNYWATEVGLIVKSGDGYVKDIRLEGIRVSGSSSSSTDSTSYAFGGLSGSSVTLQCGDCSYVRLIDGIKVWWDTRKGKIRKIEIKCGVYEYSSDD